MLRLILRLEKLLGVSLEQGVFEDKEQLFIKFPLTPNGLYLTDTGRNGIRWILNCNEKSCGTWDGQTHYVTPQLTKDVYAKYMESGMFENLRFLGVGYKSENKRMAYNTTNKRFEKKENHTFDNMDKEE